MTCTRYDRWIWDELEGRLSVAQSQALRAHLQGCPRCQRQWESAQATYRALRALPRHRAPQHLAQQVRARLHQAPSPQPVFVWWRRVALAPALGLLLALAWWGWLNYSAEPPAANRPLVVQGTTENWVEIHEQLEVADWSPTPTTHYFITTGYSR